MRTLTLAGLLMSVSLISPLSAFPFSFDFSALEDATLDFNGNNNGSSIGTFQFNRSATSGNPFGNDFKVTANYGGWPFGNNVSGDLKGLQGRIVGLFGIQNPITVVGNTQTADVVTIGSQAVMELYNGATKVLTANLEWSKIQTKDSAGTLNPLSSFNLTNFACVGPCSGNLAFLASSTNGKATATFQANSPQPTLSALTADNTTTTFFSYSGTATVPEPGFYGILALGMTGLGWFAARRRQSALS